MEPLVRLSTSPSPLSQGSAKSQRQGAGDPVIHILPSQHFTAIAPAAGFRRVLIALWKATMVVLLLIVYFLAQYDKFVISYFQTNILTDLDISPAGYGLLTGYGTSVLSALTAIPVAFIADYSSKRVWTLCVTVVWWSLMVVFQGFSKKYWQLICARLGMSFGQSATEAIAVSIISDLVPLQLIPFAESFLYVGVYIGEAVSSRISAVFKASNTSWRVALKAIGITGCVLAVVLRLAVKEPARKRELTFVKNHDSPSGRWTKIRSAAWQFRTTLVYLVSLRSFWIITLSASMRQLSGNVFGFYMPSFLQLQYPDQTTYLITTYGTIVGTVGTFSCLLGGTISSLFYRRRPTIALHLVAWGGILSSPFVIIMVFSRSLGGQDDPDRGLTILFGSMSAAYLTAELWLGPTAALVVRLIPSHLKTTGFAIYGLVNLLVYSSGPEIVGIAQVKAGISSVTGSTEYIRVTMIILAVIIPTGYCLSSVGFLWARSCTVADISWIDHQMDRGASLTGPVIEEELPLSKRRKTAFALGLAFLCALVIGLLVTSFVLGV